MLRAKTSQKAHASRNSWKLRIFNGELVFFIPFASADVADIAGVAGVAGADSALVRSCDESSMKKLVKKGVQKKDRFFASKCMCKRCMLAAQDDCTTQHYHICTELPHPLSPLLFPCQQKRLQQKTNDEQNAQGSMQDERCEQRHAGKRQGGERQAGERQERRIGRQERKNGDKKKDW